VTYAQRFPQLIERGRHLEEAALAELYRENVAAVFRYAYARLGSREDAEEVTSETFVGMLRNIRRYEGDHPAAFSAWLIQIARTRVADHFRRIQRRPTTPLDEAPPEAGQAQVVDPDESLERSLERQRLLMAVNRLTPEQAELIRLKFLVGHDNQMVARLTGRSVGAINSLQHRALRSLARILARMDAEEDSRHHTAAG
jgi:RNA polymerase sigma-70 factor (ECF subfamily)